MEKDERQARTMAAAQNIFIQEVERSLPAARQALAEMSGKPGYDQECFKLLHRFAHTLKGSGQMVGLRDIADPAFEMDTALSLIERYDVALTAGMQEFLLGKIADITSAVERVKAKPPVLTKKRITIANHRKQRILLVDDDPVIAKLAKERLELEGYIINICYDTIEADRLLKLEEPDLILLDIMLPGENGIDFCRRFRSEDKNQVIPIIFFTVKGELQDKLAGFATGADDYLAKPFAMEELVARVHASLNRLELLQGLAWQDELTRVYNRRYLYRRLEEEISKAKMLNGTFALALIDLNSFKYINDSYGHAAGDEALKWVVEMMNKIVRTTDIICRLGGDEFVLIFPGGNYQSASRVIERLENSLVSNPVIFKTAGASTKITLSAGIVSFPEDGDTCEQLLKSADAAMYGIKLSCGR